MVISHNMSAMNAQRQFGINTKEKSKSVEKLSSGYKINRAADDAAGLSISEKMRQQIRGLDRASTNAQDGISLVQVADGALAEVNDMLTRCVELSVQAANGTLSLSDRQAIQDEINQIRVEIDQISERTKFNEVRVLEPGDPGTPVFRDGDGVEYHGSLPQCITSNEVDNGLMSNTYKTQEAITYDIMDNTQNPPVKVGTGTDFAEVEHAAAYLDFSQFDATNPAHMADLIGKGMYFTCCTCSKHYSIQFVDDTQNTKENSGNHYIFKVGVQGVTSASDLIDRILDATKDNEGLGNPNDHYTKLVKDGANGDRLVVYDDRQLTNSTITYPTPSTGQNYDNIQFTNAWENKSGTASPNKSSGYGLAGPGIARAKQVYDHTEYSDERAQLALQVGAGTGDFMILKLPAISSKLIGIEDINLLTQDKATDAITLFKDAGAYVSAERSRMGAYQNALEHTINNLDNTVENTTAAESRIRDVDMAEMMVKYSKENILEQAGQSMMAQANRSTEGVLSLLQ